MAVKFIDFVVTGDPVTARATAENALTARKFVVTWHDEWTGTAERGSKAANIIAGSLAQYFKVGVRLMTAQPGETTVRIERQSSGWMGGAIGAARTTKNMGNLRANWRLPFRAPACYAPSTRAEPPVTAFGMQARPSEKSPMIGSGCAGMVSRAPGTWHNRIVSVPRPTICLTIGSRRTSKRVTIACIQCPSVLR